MIDVVHQAMPEDDAIWEALGRDREPGRVGAELIVGFFGSAYPHKGPSLLVDAAQRTEARIRVRIHGEVPEAFAAELRPATRAASSRSAAASRTTSCPRCSPGVDVAVIPSLWWDCAPLMVAECLAGRVPVLAARMGGIPDFVADGGNGLLFDGRDGADLARKLDRLAGEPGLLERLQAGIAEPRALRRLRRRARGALPRRAAAARARRRRTGERALARRPASTQSLAGINREVCDRLEAMDGIALERVSRTGAGGGPALPLPAAGRGAPPVAARPSPLGVRTPRPDPAVGVRRAPVRVGRGHQPQRRRGVGAVRARARRCTSTRASSRTAWHVVPNGVDLELFSPGGPRLQLDDAPGVRLLFVGGLIDRKGPDVLLSAFLDAFEGRDDVTPGRQGLRRRRHLPRWPTAGACASTPSPASCRASSTCTAT